MTTKRDDEQFVDEVTKRLLAEADDLSQDEVYKLHDMRRRAVQSAPSSPRYLRITGFTGLAVGAAMVALVIVVAVRTQDELPEFPLSSEVEFAAAQDQELLEQLEFLAWLEEDSSNAG